MDLDKIKELMSAMEECGMKRVSLKEKSGFELELERSSDFEVESYPLPERQTIQRAPVQTLIEEENPQQKEKKEPQKLEVKEGVEITSPMVGTFYGSPSPEDDNFVNVGDSVTEDTVVCIIEAMKVMNEVKAGKSGTVAEVLVDNAHPVEFGTKLFRIV